MSKQAIKEEKLIASVKQYPCLWDTSLIDFRDLRRKNLAFSKVAEECNLLDGETAKRHWKKLRDAHREALRRRKFSSISPWKYEREMEFLVPNTETSEKETHEEPPEEVDDKSLVFTYVEVPESSKRPVKRKYDDEVLEQERQDAQTSLFMSLCEKTKLLPPHLQLRVQREIFNSVIQAEEEALNYNYD